MAGLKPLSSAFFSARASLKCLPRARIFVIAMLFSRGFQHSYFQKQSFYRNFEFWKRLCNYAKDKEVSTREKALYKPMNLGYHFTVAIAMTSLCQLIMITFINWWICHCTIVFDCLYFLPAVASVVNYFRNHSNINCAYLHKNRITPDCMYPYLLSFFDDITCSFSRYWSREEGRKLMISLH